MNRYTEGVLQTEFLSKEERLETLAALDHEDGEDARRCGPIHRLGKSM